MTHSETIGALAAALAKAQAAVKGAKKDSTNPHFKNDYADLASTWDACREALSANSLAVTQTTEPSDGTTVTVHTFLLHASGEWMRGALTMKPQKVDPQGIGSCITYARRYALAAMVGVAPADDDGQAASQPAREEPMFKPVGYDEWATALEQTMAEGGAAAAREEFKSAPEPFRDYFTKTDKVRYDKFKAASKAKAA